MPTPEPRITRFVDASAWSPPLPEASGFDIGKIQDAVHQAQ